MQARTPRLGCSCCGSPSQALARSPGTWWRSFGAAGTRSCVRLGVGARRTESEDADRRHTALLPAARGRLAFPSLPTLSVANAPRWGRQRRAARTYLTVGTKVYSIVCPAPSRCHISPSASAESSSESRTLLTPKTQSSAPRSVSKNVLAPVTRMKLSCSSQKYSRSSRKIVMLY